MIIIGSLWSNNKHKARLSSNKNCNHLLELSLARVFLFVCSPVFRNTGFIQDLPNWPSVTNCINSLDINKPIVCGCIRTERCKNIWPTINLMCFATVFACIGPMGLLMSKILTDPVISPECSSHLMLTKHWQGQHFLISSILHIVTNTCFSVQ